MVGPSWKAVTEHNALSLGNKIKQLPEQIANLAALRKLNLAFNLFEFIGKELTAITSLTVLDISSNQVREQIKAPDFP